MSSVSWNRIIDSCSSTNDLIKEAALSGAPSTSWIASREQTGGRGRLGRTWVSSRGGMYVSILFRDLSLKNISWLPLAVGSAVHRVLVDLYGVSQIKLKWPNDLVVPEDEGFSKLGGILCESALIDNERFFVVGLGINFYGQIEVSDQKVITISELVEKKVDPDQDVKKFVEEITLGVNHLMRGDIASVKSYYESHSYFEPGMWIQYGTGNRGKYMGLSDQGGLRALVEDDVEKVILAEDVLKAAD